MLHESTFLLHAKLHRWCGQMAQNYVKTHGSFCCVIQTTGTEVLTCGSVVHTCRHGPVNWHQPVLLLRREIRVARFNSTAVLQHQMMMSTLMERSNQFHAKKTCSSYFFHRNFTVATLHARKRLIQIDAGDIPV